MPCRQGCCMPGRTHPVPAAVGMEARHSLARPAGASRDASNPRSVTWAGPERRQRAWGELGEPGTLRPCLHQGRHVDVSRPQLILR